MAKKFLWSSYRNKQGSSPRFGHRSKRPHEFDFEAASRIRKRVFLILIILAVVYLVYLFFYSGAFRLTEVNISGQTEMSLEEATETVKTSLNRRGLFHNNNYFLVSFDKIRDDFSQKEILADLEFDKKFPHTLNITIGQKLGQMVWIANEQFYTINLEGVAEKQLPIKELVNANLPVIYDLSNNPVDIDQPVADKQLIDLILEAYQDFESYELPSIDLDYFKVDGPNVNYIKIVTKQGFEIHVNYTTSFKTQITKLQKSLQYGLVDLNNLNYINLRIEDQVIYK